jgi:hypothetical protein
VLPPASLRAIVGTILEELGPNQAALTLNVHREQLISVAAGVPVLAGTVALLEQRIKERWVQ